MSTSPEVILSPEARAEKAADERVQEVEQSAQRIKKVFRELQENSSKYSQEELQELQRYFQQDAAENDFQILKMKRDKEIYLGASPATRDDRCNKLDRFLFSPEIPPEAYVLYLERRISSIAKEYERVKAEYDKLKKEHREYLDQSAKACDKSNIDEEQKYSEQARTKREEAARKRSFLQNSLGMDLQTDLEKEIAHVEKMIRNISAEYEKEKGELNKKVAAVRKMQTEFKSKMATDRVSSEDNWSEYFSKYRKNP